MKIIKLLPLLAVLCSCQLNVSSNSSSQNSSSNIINSSQNSESNSSSYYYEDNKIIVPDLNFEDPYIGVSFDEFYENYKPAENYLDAYYRTQHGFISGDLVNEASPFPASNDNLPKDDDGKYYRLTDAYFVYNESGEMVGYRKNSLTGEGDIIYYNAGYITMDDVAAYLLAFGEVPANSNYASTSSGKRSSIEKWGIYGRCNNRDFSGDTNKYPTEPELPDIYRYDYRETDFGAGAADIEGVDKVATYNNGTVIQRGVCRFVFMTNDMDDFNTRHVFYTYNHYDDFQEYLNYDGGYGERFGNMTAGNDYNEETSIKPSPYPEVTYIAEGEL